MSVDLESRDVRTTGDLGARLLIGRGMDSDPAKGVDLLKRAAEAGDAESAAVLATLTAAGAWAPQSWDGAIGWLETAARLGSKRADGQLVLLSGGDLTTGERGPGIDLASWFAIPHREPLWDRPRVRATGAFAPSAVCSWVIGQVQGRMRPALMYHGDTKTEVLDPHRSCSDFEFDIAGSDVIMILLRERIALATGVPTACMEPPRVFHYATGQDIKPHYDRLNDGIGNYGGGGYDGDRIVTFLLYLNEDFEGGELAFPKVGQSFRGRMGDGVYFAHVDAEGKPEPLSLHAGLPIRRGEKYVLSQWIHDRPLGDTRVR